MAEAGYVYDDDTQILGEETEIVMTDMIPEATEETVIADFADMDMSESAQDSNMGTVEVVSREGANMSYETLQQFPSNSRGFAQSHLQGGEQYLVRQRADSRDYDEDRCEYGESPVVIVRTPTAGARQTGEVLHSGQYVLRGNQLVRVPSRQPDTSPPLKVQLVSGAGARRPVHAYSAVPGVVQRDSKPLLHQQPSQTSYGTSILPKVQATPTTEMRGPGGKLLQKVQYYRVLPSESRSSKPQTASNLKPIVPSFSGISATDQKMFPMRGGDMAHGLPGHLSRRKSLLPGNRKPCNCTKSMCLKLYCDCFANGEFCRNCNCRDCHNNLPHEAERTKAIKACLERNPNAFQPKIGKGRTEVDRMHQKGCHCKKSSCLKNYCECYEAKVPCTIRCKCISCRNTEADRQSKTREKMSGSSGLLHLAAVAADFRPDSPLTDASSDRPDPKTQPWFYMTDEVVECTALCLVAQAEEMERLGASEADMEKAILREFGRCLQQIIDNAANANTAT